jgi:hypothetical protein
MARGGLTRRVRVSPSKLAKRDAHLRSSDFFDVERHPQVRFVLRAPSKLIVRGCLVRR